MRLSNPLKRLPKILTRWRFIIFIGLLLASIHIFSSVKIEQINYQALGYGEYFRTYFDITFLLVALGTAIPVGWWIANKLSKLTDAYQLFIKEGFIETKTVKQLHEPSDILMNSRPCEVIIYEPYTKNYNLINSSHLLRVFATNYEEKSILQQMELELEMHRRYQKLMINYIKEKYNQLDTKGIGHYKQIFKEDIKQFEQDELDIESFMNLLTNITKLEKRKEKQEKNA